MTGTVIVGLCLLALAGLGALCVHLVEKEEHERQARLAQQERDAAERQRLQAEEHERQRRLFRERQDRLVEFQRKTEREGLH